MPTEFLKRIKKVHGISVYEPKNIELADNIALFNVKADPVVKMEIVGDKITTRIKLKILADGERGLKNDMEFQENLRKMLGPEHSVKTDRLTRQRYTHAVQITTQKDEPHVFADALKAELKKQRIEIKDDKSKVDIRTIRFTMP